MITIIPKHDATISVITKNENGENLLKEIKGNTPAKVVHETGHFIGTAIKIDEFYEKLKNNNIKFVEDNNKVYTSNHFLEDKNNKTVTFYPIQKNELISVWMENEVYKKQGKPERLFYGKDDKDKAVTIRYDTENPNINQLFERLKGMINKNAD